MDLFEKATRKKLRFKTDQGNLTVEDIWDLKLEALDTLAKALNSEVKESSEESFIAPQSSINDTLSLKFSVVKHIIKVKLDEKETAKLAKEKREKVQLLMDKIRAKEMEELDSKPLEELRKELESLM